MSKLKNLARLKFTYLVYDLILQRGVVVFRTHDALSRTLEILRGRLAGATPEPVASPAKSELDAKLPSIAETTRAEASPQKASNASIEVAEDQNVYSETGLTVYVAVGLAAVAVIVAAVLAVVCLINNKAKREASRQRLDSASEACSKNEEKKTPVSPAYSKV